MFWIAHPSSGAKWTAESSELIRSMSLDIQILDPVIWSWSKHLKIPTNQFLLGFKCSTPLKLTNSLFSPAVFFSYLMHGQKIFKTLDFWFIDNWNNIDILYLNVWCWYLSEKDSTSNLFERTKSVYLEKLKWTYLFVCTGKLFLICLLVPDFHWVEWIYVYFVVEWMYRLFFVSSSFIFSSPANRCF